jgi:hypothetical protein
MTANPGTATRLRAVEATLNFARNRQDGGVWSNTDRSRVQQAFATKTVTIADATTRDELPNLDREGFTRLSDPVAMPQWDDPEWLAAIYVPRCCEVIRTLIGADLVLPLYRGVLRRKAVPPGPEGSPAPAAGFVHLDQSPSAIEGYAEETAGADFRERFRHFRMLNLWRALSPPPHNMPLALCDQRTVARRDLVVGHTVEPKLISNAVEYLTSLHNPAQQWWFYPDLAADDLLVFNGFNPDENLPIGCLHSAFADPGVAGEFAPRESIESRFFAFFA